MTIKEIYEKFDKIGCLVFATVNEFGEPETRIAHLRGYDDEGIYFNTMFTKSFYKQLMSNGNVSVCGLNGKSQVEHDEKGLPLFEPGYAARMTGKVKLISLEDIKAKNNPIFDLHIKDQEIYPAIVSICITSARGEIYDYDFEKTTRENKVQRTYFSYNGASPKYGGLKIDPEKCISCHLCKKSCSFLAIEEVDNNYKIDPTRCEECGDCFVNCPSGAISY